MGSGFSLLSFSKALHTSPVLFPPPQVPATVIRPRLMMLGTTKIPPCSLLVNFTIKSSALMMSGWSPRALYAPGETPCTRRNALAKDW